MLSGRLRKGPGPCHTKSFIFSYNDMAGGNMVIYMRLCSASIAGGMVHDRNP